MKQQYKIHRLLAIILLLVAVLFGSCNPTRHAEVTHHAVTDTLHYVLCDTTNTIMVRDTTHVTHREEVTEHIVTIYDHQTGVPIRQDIDRTIFRLADSIYAHYLDSLRAAIRINANVFHADSIQHQENDDIVTPSLSPIQLFANRMSTLFALAFVIFAIICAIRLYLSKRE